MALEIPFHQPYCAETASKYLEEVLAGGKLAGNGPFGQKCKRELSSLFQGGGIFLTPSCTSALEMAALILGVGPGDEVIVPAFTFVSTASAFALLGARPVFVDVDPQTLNLDPRCLEAALSPRTKAIVPVHYAGVACEMDGIGAIARERGVEVVEDNAHGLFGRYRGRPLGCFGSLSTLSFHATKNLTCGEGGALVVNRPDWLEKAEIAQEKGTNRSRFLMGLSDKYTWVAPGSSYLLSELNCALLWANLERRQLIQERRTTIWSRYQVELADWCQRWEVYQPVVPPEAEHPAHLYYLLVPSLEHRQALMSYLRQAGIHAAYHYQPLHTSPMGLRYGGGEAHCPVAESVAARMIRLPLYTDLTEAEQTRIVESLLRWRFP